MFKLFLSLLLMVMLFLPQKAVSQITASPPSGCAPLAVQFSGPAGATNIQWNLGSAGSTTLANPNPLFNSPGTYQITYSALVGGSPVSYSTQVVVGSPPSGSFSYLIPNTHCVPMTCTFTATGGSPGSVVSWAFGDLTPLATGSSVVHTYQFSNSFVPVAIIVDAVSGCTAAVNPTSGGTIHVSNPPQINIISSKGLLGCVPPFTTNITGSTSVSGSPLGGGLTYNWQFLTGSPGVSSAASPGIITFQQGTHTVSLIATDNNQCSDTGQVFISVVNPTLIVAVTPTVCLYGQLSATITSPQNSAIMSSSSVPVYTVFNLVPNVPNIFDSIVIMNVPGWHEVKFTVQAAGICPVFTATVPVFVEQVLASFIASTPSVGCGPTMAVTYTNTSTSNSGSPLTFTTWPSWGFNSSWQSNPMQVLTSNTAAPISFTLSQGSLNPYTLYNMFQPVITMFARSANGCEDSFVDSPHLLMTPNARFTMDKREGCVPLTVKFRDTSWALQTFPITQWTWNSGTTPNVVITSTQQVAFTYTTPGVYTATLTIQTAGGCTSTFTDNIIVSAPPTITAAIPATVCAGVPITIVMSGTSNTSPPGSINHWHVNTDKGFFSGCISDATPTFPFTHVGTHSVSITAYQNGCSSSVTLPSSITVLGPLGKFRFSTRCVGDKKSVNFDVHLQDATSATLNYGDNSPVLNLLGNPGGVFSASFNHVYPASGDYTVTLIASKSPGPCAPKTFTQVVHIRQPVARITFNGQNMPATPVALACTKSRYAFSGTNSTDHYVSCSSGYKWWFTTPNYELPPLNCQHGVFSRHPHGNETYNADDAARDTFRVAGNYTISLEVKDINGCADTAKHVFRIAAATPVFTFAANPHCFSNGPVQVINNTQNSLIAPDVITSYTWSYGDGNSEISNNPNFNPLHPYASIAPPSQTFQVMAVAKNQLNCIDTTIHVLQINNPMTGFYSPSPYACIRKGQASSPVQFQAMPGYATYSWSPGVLSGNPTWQTSNTFSNVTTNYFVPGKYVSTLTVVDAAGCKATSNVTIFANGQATAAIANPGVSAFCVPAKVALKDSSSVNITPISGYQWSLGTITSPVSAGDSIFDNIITAAGVYTVDLTVYTGDVPTCPSTASRLIYVFDTKANIEIDKKMFCLGDEIRVKAIGLKDVFAWKWFFGDLVSQPIIYNTPFAFNPYTYRYDVFPPTSSDGKTTITLKAMSDANEGCVKTQTVNVQVIVVAPGFVELNENYRHCLTKVPDRFLSTTQNPLGLNLTYNWDFGDGVKGEGNDVLHSYNTPGTYTVSLNVRDTDYGCKNTAIRNMTILPLPKAEITASDTLVCQTDTFLIHLKGIPVFPGRLTGQFTPYFDSVFAMPASNQYSIAFTRTASTQFNFSVVDTNKCESPPVSVWVNVPVPAPAVNTLTTVVIGQLIVLNATTPGNYSYHWAPEIRYLSDTINPITVSNTTNNITYSITVIDEPKQCWLVQSTYSIIILPYSSVDVPTAFTPNGDGINDVIFPDGWGIRKLIYFRVYNRWGQLIFETNEYRKGWDGIFDGVPQNMETYVYQAEIETYLESNPRMTKSGTFKLIR